MTNSTKISRFLIAASFVFAVIGFHAQAVRAQCDAFVNGCNLGSVTQWTVNDTILTSTGEPGEPPSHSFYTNSQNPLTTNWYHWTAPQNGTVVVNTQGTNPNAAPPNYQTPYVMDTVIAAYTGATLATLVRKDESDDWNPNNPPNCSCTFPRTLPEAYWSSCMMFPVTAGTTYHFQFDHLSETNPANNDFVLNLYYRAPTSAEVSIGGKVIDDNGNALSKVTVSLTKPNGDVLSAITSAFGFYRFDEIEVGQSYVLQASSKRFHFQNNPRVILAVEDIESEDFTGAGNYFQKE